MSTLATLYAAMRQIGRPVEGRPSPVLRRLLEARTDTPAARRPLSNATIRRVHATAIPAPSPAVKRRKIAAHLGEHVELPSGRADRALVWTAHRVEEWRRTGQRPAATMVWTPEQAGAFLDQVAADDLYALWHLVAPRPPPVRGRRPAVDRCGPGPAQRHDPCRPRQVGHDVV